MHKGLKHRPHCAYFPCDFTSPRPCISMIITSPRRVVNWNTLTATSQSRSLSKQGMCGRIWNLCVGVCAHCKQGSVVSPPPPPPACKQAGTVVVMLCPSLCIQTSVLMSIQSKNPPKTVTEGKLFSRVNAAWEPNESCKLVFHLLCR